MKVKCVRTEMSDLPQSMRTALDGFMSYESFEGLVTGKEYVVYAMTVYRGYLWIYICDEDYQPGGYPVWYPLPLFEVIDRRMSRYWEIGVRRSASKEDVGDPIVAFKEWVEDFAFYERLTDGDAQAVATFENFKATMDDEFEG